MNHAPGAAPPTEKLAQLCDADHRRRHPTAEALAAGITAGGEMPDPHAHHDGFHHVLDAARTWLEGQPSSRTMKAAARRLTTAIHQMANDAAGRQS